MTENNLTDQNSSNESQNKFQNSAKSNSSINPPQISPDNLLTRLAEATLDLFYISETDAPFEAFVWQRETNSETFSTVNAFDILRFSGKTPDTTFREQSVEDFFRFPTTEQEWQSDEERDIVKRYIKLKELIIEALRDPKVIKIGDVEIEVYLVGIDGNGNLAGVKTEAVET